MANYCHNCGHHSTLINGVYCAYCLGHFARHGRLPMPTDVMVSTDSLSKLYSEMGWSK